MNTISPEELKIRLAQGEALYMMLAWEKLD